MPLDLIVDTIDSVPEAIRGEYVEKDGKFHLNVTGLEDTTGLKSALKKERDTAANATKQAKDLAAKVAKWESLGKSDEDIKALLDKAEADRLENLTKSGDKDALVNDLKAQHQKAIDAAAKKWTDDRASLEKELNLSRASEREAIVTQKVNSALVKGKVTDEGIALLTRILSERVAVETVDGERTISIMQADGKNPMAGSGDGGVATFEDLVKEATEKYPSLFQGSGAGGGGKSSKDGGAGGAGGAKTMKRADFDKLSVWEQGDKVRAKWTIVD